MFTVNDRVAVIAHPEQTGTVTAMVSDSVQVMLDRPISLSVGTTLIDSIWRDASQLAPLTKVQAQIAIVTDVLADPDWTMRVVAAALVAQDEIEKGHPAWNTLVDAFTKEASA